MKAWSPAPDPDNRRQTFSNQCSWSAASPRPAYKTTLTCGEHELHEDKRAAAEPAPAHTATYCGHTTVQRCAGMLALAGRRRRCRLLPTEAALIQRGRCEAGGRAPEPLTSSGENVFWQVLESSPPHFASRRPRSACQPHAFTPRCCHARTQVCAHMFCESVWDVHKQARG